MEDLEGGHFSISNPGIFGSLYGTPIIPLGQMAVFNLNSIRERVVPVDGEAKIRPVSCSLAGSIFFDRPCTDVSVPDHDYLSVV